LFDVITGSRQIKGITKELGWPQEASLKPLIVYITGRYRRMKILFAGYRYMRMQCEIGSKEEFERRDTTTIIWSGV
jgi:hypothetical protein